MYYKIKKVPRSFLYICTVISIAAGGYITVAKALEPKVLAQIEPMNSPLSKAKHSKYAKTATSSSSVSPQTSQTPATAVSKQLSPPPTPAIKDKPLFVSPEHSSRVYQAASQSDSSDAAILNRLASKSTAKWFGGWSGDIRSAVNTYVSSAQASGSVSVMVAYNIPFRDCGGESAGGVANASGYDAWIKNFSDGIAGRQSIVILEPDAIAADCFSSDRAAMLSRAVDSLNASGTSVYLDGGNPTWRSSYDMANRLRQAGISKATGFSLNVSNFQTTASNIAYGNSLSAQLGGKHFVIDTSRNGNGPTSDYQWCNPGGRALGQEPTTNTGQMLVDAYLWIKVPGESDGYCGPSIDGTSPPAAGSFWTQYALQLARNAGW